VFTTSMIYASLKAIPAWNNIWTKLGYLVMSLMSGAVLAMMIFQAFGLEDAAFHLFNPVGILLALGLLVKLIYWWYIDKTKARSTAESATGLGGFGKVSLAESPHGEDNYLLKEMGFRIARKHASKLRIIAALLGFIVPFFLIGIAMHYLQGMEKTIFMIAATMSCLAGLAFERWLFFAQAKHAVTLYYGETKV